MQIRKLGVVLFLIFGLGLPAAPVWAQSAPAIQQAEALHQQGVQLYQARSYREAAQAFEQSEQLVRNPLNHWNLMRCYEELQEYPSALRWVEQYLANPDLSAADRAEGEQHRQQIQAAINSGGGAPGASAGGSSLIGPWVLLGSGLALALTGGVLDLVAFLQSDTDQGQADTFGSFDEYEDWRSGVRNLALSGDVLVGVGAAAAVGGLVWLLVARSRRSSGTARVSPFSLVAGRDGWLLQTQVSF